MSLDGNSFLRTFPLECNPLQFCKLLLRVLLSPYMNERTLLWYDDRCVHLSALLFVCVHSIPEVNWQCGVVVSVCVFAFRCAHVV